MEERSAKEKLIILLKSDVLEAKYRRPSELAGKLDVSLSYINQILIQLYKSGKVSKKRGARNAVYYFWTEPKTI